LTSKNSLIILDKSSQFDDFEKFLSSNRQIIAVDFETHQKLEEKKILHEFLDNYLKKNQREALYDYVLTKYNWYEDISMKKDFEINNINMLSLMSPLEFHEFLLSILLKFTAIQNLLKENNPNEIFVSESLSQYVSLIKTDITLNAIKSVSNIEKGFSTDKIEIRFNIFSKPLTFYLSKKTYSFLKKKFENLICNVNNLWFKQKSAKEVILLVEFNIAQYHELIKSLSKSKKQLVLLNRRRPAILGKNTIQILKSNNVKILNSEKFLNKQNTEFLSEKKRFVQNLNRLWEIEELFSLFSINDKTYWPLIKNRLKNIFEYRLDDYLQFIFQSKKFLSELNIKQIICLSESGETENILLQNIDNNIESILLQHSFLRYHNDVNNLQWRYEDQKMIHLKSKKFFVWGKNDLEYFSEKSLIKKENMLITGSPRHDDFFEPQKYFNKKTILITLSPISERSGLGDVNLVIKYNKILTDIVNKIKKINNSKIIIKLHPGENPHNIILLKCLNEIQDITVHQTKNSKDLVMNCDLLINISPELYDSSTIMLEGLILKKPVIQFILDNEFLNIQPLSSPIIQMNELNDLVEVTQKILENEKFKETIIKKIPLQTANYLSYQNSSSHKILELIEKTPN
tara:strand:+ start:992 stop:2878 length:1887 start_codon:yes stop_codon:yes gene_type:complete